MNGRGGRVEGRRGKESKNRQDKGMIGKENILADAARGNETIRGKLLNSRDI